MIHHASPMFILSICILVSQLSAFSLSSASAKGLGRHVSSSSMSLGSEMDEENSCWNPKLRKSMTAVASMGVVETAFLTASKITTNDGLLNKLCPGDGGSSCTEVLNGPYAWIPGTSIPLSALGLVAYSTVAFLALQPLLFPSADDDDNRTLLVAATTSMGIFSVFLMTFLFGVLHLSCPFCVISAAFSIILAKLAWIGGALPAAKAKEGAQLAAGGAVSAFVTAFFLFTVNDGGAPDLQNAGELVSSDSTTLVTSSEGKRPPPILSSSSPRAMTLAKKLEKLDTRMYGAFWCSHCYDQKEALGREAYAKVHYVECSKEGYEAQTKLCKEADVPGYPTWSINGKLYPGEQSLDELEEIVAGIESARQ